MQRSIRRTQGRESLPVLPCAIPPSPIFHDTRIPPSACKFHKKIGNAETQRRREKKEDHITDQPPFESVCPL